MTTEIVTATETLPALAPQAANPGMSRTQQLVELQAEAQFLDVAFGLAEKACAGQLVAAHFKGKPADGAIAIAYGASLGWHWTKSLQDVYVVNGKPSIQSKEMRELLIRAGHTVEEVEVGPERVVLVGHRRDSDIPVTVEWTMDKARQAGLLSNKNYEKYPEHMLYARATTDLAKRMAPDALSGLGIVEELQDISATPRRVKATAGGVSALKDRLGVGAAPSPQAQPEQPAAADPAQEAMVTAAQLKKLHTLMGKWGLSERDKALGWLSEQVKRTLSSSNELTRVEAGDLIDFIESEQAADRAQAEEASK